MKFSIGTIAMLTLMLSLSGCWEDPKLFPCETGSGVIDTDTRSVSGFTKITVDIPADVYLHRDTAFSVVIEAQESLLDWIDTDVSGNVLEIRNDRCFRNHKTIRIDVYLPEVDMIEVDGSGDVYGLDSFATTGDLDLQIHGSGSIDFTGSAAEVEIEILGSGDAVLNVNAERIDTKITGSGDLIALGTVDIHKVRIEGSGSLEAFDLITEETEIMIAGSGDAEVYADSLLTVKINGSGDVFYQGSPLLEVEIRGSGEVINGN